MARYKEASCRLCRREGCKLFLKGDRCYTEKCAIVNRNIVPGQHGAGRKKVSEYSLQLREKQKVKRAYGLLEKQFKKYYDMADRMKGVTGENMLQLLERRLDNVVYRMGIGVSRANSRQIVNHANILVNGKVIDIPSYLINAGDVIAIKESRKDNAIFKELRTEKPMANMPKWVSFDNEKLEGKVLQLPERSDIDLTIEEQLIVELYSK